MMLILYLFLREMEKKIKKRKFPLSVTLKEILSIPFIWMMLVPAIFLDIFIFFYQNTAIRLYGIPLVKRSDYIVFDRELLRYLTLNERINCLYCSYVNGLLSYAVEVAGRTEKYWCPIKHKKKTLAKHNWQEHFAEYNDEEKFREVYGRTDEYFSK